MFLLLKKIASSLENVLIIGGTSGLGLELAKLFALKDQVFITGRKFSDSHYNINYRYLNLSGLFTNAANLDEVLHDLFPIKHFIYAAGYYQEGSLSSLSDQQILEMTSVGFLAPALIMKRILQNQNSLDGFIAISSTSQWKPRQLEPIYAGAKSGFSQLTRSLALDPAIKKTLLVCPGGMRTEFWEGTDRDISSMLPADQVARQIIDHYKKLTSPDFLELRILRDPQRLETYDINGQPK